MKANRHVLRLAAFILLVQARPIFGQGCIIARSSEQPAGPESEGGYLTKGEWDFYIGYRHQFSFRHFVGDVEQKQRIQDGTQVMNKINLENFSATYQATDRFSFSVDLPLLLASRRINNSPVTNTAQGIGDISFSANAWLWDPKENTKGNISLGFGISVPSGKDNVMNTVDYFNGKGPQTQVVDYSIQPGTGGYGLIFQWQSFKNLGTASQVFFNGSYTATPQDTNGVPSVLVYYHLGNALQQTNSISDQYLLEAGVSHYIKRVRGLAVTFGPRWEGVPAHDLIGKSDGFRRPGYAVSLAPGIQYAWGRNLITAEVGRAIYRNRTVGATETLPGSFSKHGDAAFADYIWLASYSFRAGGRH